MGPPPEGALNVAAWQIIRDLVSSDPALNQAAWEALRGIEACYPLTGRTGVEPLAVVLSSEQAQNIPSILKKCPFRTLRIAAPRTMVNR